MSESIMIRHSAYKVDWTQLKKEELEKLLRHEKDPGIDEEKLEEQLDKEKLRDQNFTKIYTSPLKRARQTAEKISGVLDIQVEEKEELKEHSFDGVPEEVFREGSEAVRQHLLDKTWVKSVETDFMENKAGENILMISHGFKMRNFHRELFDSDFRDLRDDRRFREYLTGFAIREGETRDLREGES
ncbi:MAG: histidine phosphatase family protein [Candidatus Nanosalina sp.]